MPIKKVFSNYALIGEELELKQNVSLEISQDGTILKIEYDNAEDILEIRERKSNILMLPGLMNSHIHIGDSFAKEFGYNKELSEVVAPPSGIKHKLLNLIEDKIQLIGIKNAIWEMLSNGTTFFADFREKGIKGIEILKTVIKELPIHNKILGRFENVDEIDSIFELADGIGLVSYKSIISEIKNEILKLKRKYGKIVACHIAENKRESELLENLFNDDIVDILVHGTHFNRADLEKIRNSSKNLILCPRSNGYFGVGFPPIKDILELELSISLGTDNVMVNNLDLFEELRYFYRISRILCPEKRIEAKELLKMVTINAAKNFKLESSMGSLTKGKFADFFLIDLNHFNFYCSRMEISNIYPLIIQRTKSENIKKTYVKGELAFERI